MPKKTREATLFLMGQLVVGEVSVEGNCLVCKKPLPAQAKALFVKTEEGNKGPFCQLECKVQRDETHLVNYLKPRQRKGEQNFASTSGDISRQGGRFSKRPPSHHNR